MLLIGHVNVALLLGVIWEIKVENTLVIFLRLKFVFILKKAFAKEFLVIGTKSKCVCKTLGEMTSDSSFV